MNEKPQVGAATFESGTSDFNAADFIARQVLSGANIAGLVQVQAVHASTVDVLPLVNQVDGSGNVTPHLTVFGLQWFGLQSGTSAVIIPPTVGDIGMAIYCDRDISSVISNKGQANPGSSRRFSMSDGIYFGGIPGLNAAATQFVQFLGAGAGITVTTPGVFTINAGGKTWSFGSAGFTMSTGVVDETHQHEYSPGTGTPGPTGVPIA